MSWQNSRIQSNSLANQCLIAGGTYKSNLNNVILLEYFLIAMIFVDEKRHALKNVMRLSLWSTWSTKKQHKNNIPYDQKRLPRNRTLTVVYTRSQLQIQLSTHLYVSLSFWGCLHLASNLLDQAWKNGTFEWKGAFAVLRDRVLSRSTASGELYSRTRQMP